MKIYCRFQNNNITERFIPLFIHNWHFLKNEEKQIQKQETEIERLQQLCYRQNPVLQQLKDEEKNIRSEIASLENAYGMIKKIIIKAEQERQKSKEELYALVSCFFFMINCLC